jgi:putative phosphoserine phosphatase/1-acylglycerol-3-phosphate O-acyltransferase
MVEKAINVYKVVIAFALIILFGTLGSLLRIVSFGLLTNFNRTILIPLFCKLTLTVMGIRVENRVILPQIKTPHFFTFNHNSYLDGFVLMGLGLKDMRILMSEKMLIFFPVALISFAIGLLYIPQKKNKERRMKCFFNVEKRINEKRVSIMGSSEGVHRYGERIAPFNRGVYHMALNCKIPVVPLFIYTPIESNPYANFRPFKRGTVIIETLGVIPTSNWKLENLDNHIDDVRKLYVKRFNEYYNMNTI